MSMTPRCAALGFGRRALVACTSLLLLAGCGGSNAGQPAPATVGSTFAGQTAAMMQSPTTSGQSDAFLALRGSPAAVQVIVADSGRNSISVFDATGHLQKHLTKGLASPEGLSTDAAGSLYVANTQGHDVLVYAQPYATVTATLADPAEYPTDVAVSSKGLVAATNLQNEADSGGNVTFYAKGATTACASVSDPNWNGMSNGAFDAAGNLYIEGDDNDGNPLIGEISGGCAATSVTTLTAGNAPFAANLAGVAVVHGNVLLLDQNINTFSPVIYTYAPPAGGSLGSPTATTTLTAGTTMTGFAMTEDTAHLWIAHSDEDYGRIEYTYPRGKFVQSFNEPNLMTEAGIAVNPAARP